MGPLLVCFALGLAPAGPQGANFVAISVYYNGRGAPPPAGSAAGDDIGTLRQDLAAIRSAGFNAITTRLVWRESEPSRGAYNLLQFDRMVAAATEVGLKVQVEVFAEPHPSWATDDTNVLAGHFYEYVRRRVAAKPAVISVILSAAAGSSDLERATVGRSAGALTPRQARKALWAAIATGSRRFVFVDDVPVSPSVLALGETVGVITRNLALFAPLEPRPQREGDVTITGGDKVSVHILESADAVAIIGVNHASEARRVTITFPPEIPEAIWQNMEAGIAVHFVMGSKGPFLEHTFAPEDVLVLAISKKLRLLARRTAGRVR